MLHFTQWTPNRNCLYKRLRHYGENPRENSGTNGCSALDRTITLHSGVFGDRYLINQAALTANDVRADSKGITVPFRNLRQAFSCQLQRYYIKQELPASRCERHFQHEISS